MLNSVRLSEQQNAPAKWEEHHVKTARLEAFSDGVLAIVITIMVLELHIPNEPTWHALGAVASGFLTYLLSFVYIGIYWNNHHHLMLLCSRVTGAILWANMALLFFLSLTPMTTRWMDDSDFASVPTVVYGIGLLLNALAYTVLVRTIMRDQGADGPVRRAFGSDRKGTVSVGIYVLGIALSFFWVPGGLACYIIVAMIWLVPDRRVERIVLAEDAKTEPR
jgi:uncharacterized membrane protein